MSHSLAVCVCVCVWNFAGKSAGSCNELFSASFSLSTGLLSTTTQIPHKVQFILFGDDSFLHSLVVAELYKKNVPIADSEGNIRSQQMCVYTWHLSRLICINFADAAAAVTLSFCRKYLNFFCSFSLAREGNKNRVELYKTSSSSSWLDRVRERKWKNTEWSIHWPPSRECLTSCLIFLMMKFLLSSSNFFFFFNFALVSRIQTFHDFFLAEIDKKVF